MKERESFFTLKAVVEHPGRSVRFVCLSFLVGRSMEITEVELNGMRQTNREIRNVFSGNETPSESTLNHNLSSNGSSHTQIHTRNAKVQIIISMNIEHRPKKWEKEEEETNRMGYENDTSAKCANAMACFSFAFSLSFRFVSHLHLLAILVAITQQIDTTEREMIRGWFPFVSLLFWKIFFVKWKYKSLFYHISLHYPL